MITLAQMENVMEEHVADDTLAFIESCGIDGEAAGLFCAQMARSALRSLGLPDDGSEQEPGASITTVGLACFEAALRAVQLTFPGSAVITYPSGDHVV